MARLFFGLELPPKIKARLLKIRSAVPGAKWQGAEQLHITLLFLGAVSKEDLEALAGSARGIKSEPFLLDVAGVSCFGQPRRPKNLWAGVQPEAPVAALNKSLGARMEKFGFGAESRVFHPHITLARFKRHAGSVEPLLVEYGDSGFGQFQVTEFVLFESKPGPAGSVYSVIERFPLHGAD